ncbi:MAG: hypothetical protein RL226_421 [Bacteroidota bacterium]|jgi:DNA-binding MarR family transcriptional regulator
MKLEEAIKQKQFKSEFQKLGLNVMHVAGMLDINQQRFFRKYDLTGQQYNILRILRGQKGSPIGVYDLVDRMIDRSSNTSRLVEKLKTKGLCDRKVCPTNRRQAEVTITQAGLDLLKEIDGSIEGFDQQLFGMTEEEAKKLNELLDKLRSGLITIETNTK